MPTRTQMIAATPRCPGMQVPFKGWQECGRALIWKHLHEAWMCPRHGLVLTDHIAALLDAA